MEALKILLLCMASGMIGMTITALCTMAGRNDAEETEEVKILLPYPIRKPLYIIDYIDRGKDTEYHINEMNMIGAYVAPDGMHCVIRYTKSGDIIEIPAAEFAEEAFDSKEKAEFAVDMRRMSA